MKPVFCILLFLLYGLFGCNSTQKEEADLLELFQQEKELNCRLLSMKDSIDTEWENTNFLLEKNLPSDMPSEEKANMLKVRNANLIRMFQSFDDMDKKVKIALQKTEQMDEQMTKRITTLKQEIHRIESQKMILFEKLYQAGGTEKVAHFKHTHETILSENCKEL